MTPRLLVCCEPDLPSANMRAKLFEHGGWEEAKRDGDHVFHVKGDDVMISMPEKHILTDNVDVMAREQGFDFDTVIYMSKHAAASGEPAITVHPIGNLHENRFGGRAETLVKPDPGMMSQMLRTMKRVSDLDGFMTCFEVTHHGPYLETPTMFIEIGSDERNWGNLRAAAVQARVIAETAGYESDYPKVIGIAGGHYALRFTDLVLTHKVDMGHMIPNYQLEGRDDGDLLRMVRAAAESTGTKMVYMHRNALKKPVQRHIMELVEGEGYEMVRSADFEELPQ